MGLLQLEICRTCYTLVMTVFVFQLTMYYNFAIYVPFGASDSWPLGPVALGASDFQIVKPISDRNVFTSYFIDKLC